LSGHSDLVVEAAFSSDGKRIVTASVDGTARIWDTVTGQTLQILKGHSAQLTDAVFSPDDQYVATSSRDNTVRIWDAATGNEIIQLVGHTDVVMAVNFSPDGRYLLTAGYDGKARIYLVRFEEEVALGRSLLSKRQLTCAERVKYLHEDPCPATSPVITPAP
jgi:WD40 repeat protein